MVTVRPATPVDVHAIATVHVRTWQAAYDGLIPAEALAGLDVDARAAFWGRVLDSLTPPGAWKTSWWISSGGSTPSSLRHKRRAISWWIRAASVRR